jgi:hypothetical protein
LIALIRYQRLPDTDRPPQVARQLPPVTVATTVVLVPVPTAERIAPLTEALVRRFTPQAAAIVVAPSTFPGMKANVRPNKKKADRRAVRSTTGLAGRTAGRARSSNPGASFLKAHSVSTPRTANHHPIGPCRTPAH